jgi:hypothetical protein
MQQDCDNRGPEKWIRPSPGVRARTNGCRIVSDESSESEWKRDAARFWLSSKHRPLTSWLVRRNRTPCSAVILSIRRLYGFASKECMDSNIPLFSIIWQVTPAVEAEQPCTRPELRSFTQLMHDVHPSVKDAGRSILLVPCNYFRALTNKETCRYRFMIHSAIPVLHVCLRPPTDTHYQETRLAGYLRNIVCFDMPRVL